MFENRPISHLGIASNDPEKDALWFQETLGFKLVGRFPGAATEIFFVKGENTLFEIFNPGDPIPAELKGKIDHFCFESTDIEADYAYVKEQGYEMVTPGIVDVPTLWENGVRIFKFAGETGEIVEFCQIL